MFNKKNDYFLIAVGCIIMAAAINVFLDPNEIVIGGATGIAIIIAHICENRFGFSFPLWLSNSLINIPLFMFAFKISGFNAIKRSLFGAFFLSLSLFFTQYLPQLKDDLFLASVFGGLLSGIGIGMVLKRNSSTGGSDTASTVFHRFIPHISVSKIMFFIDASIILIGLYVFGFHYSLYALIATFITAKTSDIIIEGLNFAKAVYIISDENKKIGSEINSLLERGATYIFGKGAYSNNQKNIIMCVIPNKQLPALLALIKSIDLNAFIIINDVKEIYGNGFKDIKKNN